MKLVIDINTDHPTYFKGVLGEDNRREMIIGLISEVSAHTSLELHGQIVHDGVILVRWFLRPVSKVSPDRAKQILKDGSATFGNYSKFATSEEDEEIRRIWNMNTSGNSSWYSTLCRIAAGDYSHGW